MPPRNGLYLGKTGTKFWYKDGKYHKEDGPAVEYTNGSYMWYHEGHLHRVDGPAAKFGNVYLWFLYGKKIPVNSQDAFQRFLKLKVFI